MLYFELTNYLLIKLAYLLHHFFWPDVQSWMEFKGKYLSIYDRKIAPQGMAHISLYSNLWSRGPGRVHMQFIISSLPCQKIWDFFFLFRNWLEPNNTYPNIYESDFHNLNITSSNQAKTHGGKAYNFIRAPDQQESIQRKQTRELKAIYMRVCSLFQQKEEGLFSICKYFLVTLFKRTPAS